jgi:3-deoxy-D-manno-octulosonic-acid transferase
MQRVIGAAILAIYLALTALGAPLLRLVLARRAARGSEDPNRWREKLGLPGVERPEGTLVWLHAASVGELLSVVALIRSLAAARPDLCPLVTTSTQTSARLAAERLPARALHQYLPLDTPGAVRHFLDHWHPDAAVWVESELWPRLVEETAARGIPMLLIGARMSDHSAARWRRLGGLAARLLGRFAVVQVQDAQTARHFVALGVRPERLQSPGSLKEAAAPLPFEVAERDRLAALWAGRPRWLAASTHPGEDAVVLAAHRRAAAALPGLLTIIAPRHPERGAAVAEAVQAAGLTLARRGASGGDEAGAEVFLADTLGEMGLWFDLAPVAFMGGSLVPVGGHNPFEPVAQGCALLHGPEICNFCDAYARLDAAGGARQVTDAQSLADAVAALLAQSGAPARAQADRARAAMPPGADAALHVALAAVLSVLAQAGAL